MGRPPSDEELEFQRKLHRAYAVSVDEVAPSNGLTDDGIDFEVKISLEDRVAMEKARGALQAKLTS